MKWTEAQYEAITRSGSNIIVSAGAGSGKTAVLTARVIDKIIHGVNINELLILTFTKAAALEMKERIRTELGKNEAFQEQTALLDSSYITTFDSFALAIVNKYHHVLNISQDVTIAPDSLVEAFTLDVIDEIFENRYATKDPEFQNVISAFCMKDDRSIKDAVCRLNEKLNRKVDKQEYLDTYFERVFTDQSISESVDRYVQLIRDKVQALRPLAEDLMNECDERCRRIVDNFMNPAYEASTYQELKTALDFDLPRKTKDCTDNFSACRSCLKQGIDEILMLLGYNEVSELKAEAVKMRPVLKVMVSLIRELDGRITEYKQEHNIYTFYDIARLAIRLVKDHPDVRQELKDSYKEIMIDEYQDTSDLQEELVSLIANHNAYMVGDIKQSIYRFRNADPTLFKEKYDSYTDYRGNAAKEVDTKIDLSANFRSREEVIETVNRIFDHVMTDAWGGADYARSHRMEFGNERYRQVKANLADNRTEMLNYALLGDTFSRAEREAFVIAYDIRAKLNCGYEVYDKKTDRMRKAVPGDFAILIDRGRDFETYKKIFEYLELPLSVHKDESLTEGPNFRIIRNIMRFIIKISRQEYDTEFNHLYASLARSFLFQTSDEELFLTLQHQAVQGTALYTLAAGISSKLSVLSNEEFIRTIIDEFHFYDKIITVGDLDKAYAETAYLYELARSLNDSGMGIVRFTEYLDKVIEYGLNLEYPVNVGGDNAIRIMTIHKSKGLEFGVCYFSGLASRFNVADVRERFVFDDRLGIITPYFENGIRETFLKELYKYDYNRDEISEKIRLFYVALTRTREKIIIVDDYEAEKDEVKPFDESRCNSFKQLLESVIVPSGIRQTLLNPDDIVLTDKYNEVKSMDLKHLFSGKHQLKTVDVTPYLSANPPAQDGKKHFSKVTKGILSAEDRSKMELGTMIHYVLEVLDFKADDLFRQIDGLGIPEVYKQKIRHFAGSELFRQMKTARIFKEYEFIAGSTRGIIDLMAEYDDHIDIIDYKLKNIRDEAYKEQLNGYKAYISQRTKKPAKAYIYSIIDETFMQM